jgi:pimeloyl-ACP methyl ester carboxylesterase
MSVHGDERDLKRVVKGIDTRYTIEAADRLGRFEKPALIAWSRDDRFFKPAHAERLAQERTHASNGSRTPAASRPRTSRPAPPN